MLTREQIKTLIAIRNREDSVTNPRRAAYRLPIDVIRKIANVGLDTDPNSNIVTLLHHIAYGNLASAKAMLDINPALIGRASHVETPSGLVVRFVKPYECALGGGDARMAEMIAGYFNQFTDGAEEKAAQDAKYLQYIDDMLSAAKNPPYDFTLLIKTLIAASDADVAAERSHDLNRDSALYHVLVQFRKDFTPGIITSGMHFNYLHLLSAFEVYAEKYNDLYKSGGNNYAKLRLFKYQVIGFIQRGLPAIDRMILAQGLYETTGMSASFARLFKLKYDNADFPVTASDSSRSGLGYDWAVDQWGRRTNAEACEHSRKFDSILEWKRLCKAKAVALQSLCGGSDPKIFFGL